MQKDIMPIKDFVAQFKSVVLSTLDKEGFPYLSYAPFVRFQDTYYILVSEMAEHTKNVKHHADLGLLFVEDETKTSSIFFRKRLSYKTKAKIIQPNDFIKEALKERLGNMVDTLFAMDFVVIEVNIITGKYIVGPGSAFHVSNNEEIMKQIGQAHKQNHK